MSKYVLLLPTAHRGLGRVLGWTACAVALVVLAGWLSPLRAQLCDPAIAVAGGGHVRGAVVGGEFAVEVGPSLSFVRLENADIRVVYGPYVDNSAQFAIREFVIKSAGEDQVCADCGAHYLGADAGAGPLVDAHVTSDGLDRKTVRLTWAAWNPAGQFVELDERIVQEITIFPRGRFLRIDYIDVERGINIVDIGRPGSTLDGVHYAHGGDTWVRDYVTADNVATAGSYYNRYAPDGVLDPVDGGSLNFNQHFIAGVYRAANGRGFGRVLPVSHVGIVKLLLTDGARRGFEFFPHPFYQDHVPFTGYLFAVTGGEAEIESLGQSLAQGMVGTPELDCGALVELTADPYHDWTFAGWSGALTGFDNPEQLTLAGTPVQASFAPSPADHYEDFESYLVGDDPIDWLDTAAFGSTAPDDTLFGVDEHNANLILGTDSASPDIHTHYVGGAVAGVSGYELSGRMYMTAATGGIGVTAFSQYPLAATYYRLERSNTGSFQLTAVGTDLAGGPRDTDVTPYPFRWYRFCLRVEAGDDVTTALVRVWEDGTAEPADWQAFAFDDSPNRLASGTFGFWSFNGGSKYFDEIAVRALPADAIAPTIGDLHVHVDGTDATIRWTTNESTNAAIDYGVNLGFGSTASENAFGSEHSVELTGLPAGVPIYFRARSTDVAGNVGVSMDRVFAVEPGFAHDFDLLPPGLDPEGWFDTAEAFSLVEEDRFAADLVNGESVFGTDASLDDLHSHYIDRIFGDVEYRGTLRVADVGGGAGCTFASGFPSSPVYYRLGADPGGNFVLHAEGSTLNGELDTGVPLAANYNYFFRVQCVDLGSATEIRARVWPEGILEPAAWNVVATDATATRRTEGVIGVWCTGAGSKSFDDLEASALPEVATPDAVPPAVLAFDILAEHDRATITVATDEHTTIDIDYGIAALDQEFLDGTLRQQHAVTLTGLTEGTYHQVQVTVVDAFGNSTTTGVASFVTTIESYQSSFGPLGSGADPAGWVDTGAFGSLTPADDFSIFAVDGENVFGTESTATNLHSHLMTPDASGFDRYVYTGRVRITDPEGGVGVTFLSQFLDDTRYYRLRRFGNGGTFHIAPQGTLPTSGSVDSGVVPLVDVWYRFKIDVRDVGTETAIRAKVWTEGEGEPVGWSIDCVDDSATRLTEGTIGVWTFEAGAKYFDDLRLVRLPNDTGTTLDLTTVGGGTIAIDPLRPEYYFGETVTLTASPAIGWAFDGWSGDLVGNETPTSLTLDVDRTVTASFLQLTPNDAYNLTVNTLGNGTVAASPDQPFYFLDQTVTLTPIPAPNWRFVDWSGDVESIEEALVLTIGSDVTLAAAFSATVLDENFETFAPGDDPAGWIDTAPFSSLVEDDALFDVQSFGGSRALVTSSTATNIHSHFVPGVTGVLNGYDYTGRMRTSNSQGGIGVTFFSGYPEDTSYYRLRRYLSNAFHLTASGTAFTGGTLATDVVPSANTWYRFRVQVEDTGSETQVRAKVWADGSPEPIDWQADAVDASASRLTEGTVGVWSFHLGSKGWDDLTVKALPSGGPFTIATDVFGSGSIAIDPDQSDYDYGELVTFTANPSVGHTFVGWSGDAAGSDPSIELEVTHDLSVTANFAPVTLHSVAVTVVGNGTVERTPDLADYPLGSVVTLTAAPLPGHAFLGFSGDVTASTEQVDVVVTGDLIITAEFGPVSIDEEFTGPVGSDPIDWFDTEAGNSLVENDSYFAIADDAGESVFRTSQSLTNIHSHYVGIGSEGLTGYRYTGRMKLSSITAGVGVTFGSQFPIEASYYRLRRYSGTSFHIAPLGASITGGVKDSGVTPTAGVWYRFAVEFEDTGSRTDIRAKVWREGTPEPIDWQIDCFDESANRLTAGTIGVWSHGSGTKSYDDLAVIPLAAPVDPVLMVEAVGGGTATVEPDLPSYPFGSTVNLSAVADSGFVFTGWTGTITSNDNPLTLTLLTDHTITANFAPVAQHAIDVTAVGDGTVTLDPALPTYTAGSVVTVTAVPGPGSSFSRYVGDIDGVVAQFELLVTTDLVFEAHFVPTSISENFDAYSDGDDPAGWFDTDRNNSLALNDAVFEATGFGADRVFGTRLPWTNVHSHYLTATSRDMANYRYRGRMALTDLDGGIGVTFASRFPSELAYYRLRRYQGTNFHIAPIGTQVTSGNVDSGVSPTVGDWFEFVIEVENRADATEIRAKVWAEGDAEPSDWQIDCEDASPSRITQGTFGVWAHGRGEKWFDDLVTQPLGSASSFDLHVSTSGQGSVSLSPMGSTFAPGSVVTLQATAAPGWVFREWAGTTSDASNPLELTMLQDEVIAAVFVPTSIDEDFESFSPGDDPVDWIDTDANNSLAENDTLFGVIDVAGENGFGTSSTATNIHSHYVGAGAATLANYTLTGRMQATSGAGGLGVTFLSGFPDEASYYRLRRFVGTSFHIAPLGTLMTGGQTDTGVTPIAGAWYRFRIEVVDTGTRTEVRAKVWGDGDAEPVDWQADCFDDSVDRLTVGTIGVWSFAAGDKLFDDFEVQLPTLAGPFALDVGAVGNGTVDVTPDLAQYDFGDVVELSATPLAGSAFVGWSGDLESLANPTPYVVTEAASITAEFAPIASHTVTLTTVGDGTVTIDPDLATYTTGDSVTVTATAGPGHAFLGFGGDVVSDTSPLTFLVGGDTDLTATFVPQPYTIDIVVNGSGAVDLDPDQPTYQFGDVVTVTAVANAGAAFDGFGGDLAGANNPTTVVVAGDVVADATFTAGVVQQDFTPYADGDEPDGWIDTQPNNSLGLDDSLFQVGNVDGNPALVTSSTANNIHSHYLADGLSQLASYRFQGRMRASSTTSGIGVTFGSRFTSEAKYYRLRRYAGTTFHIAPFGTSITGGEVDTGVTPVPGVWYRFVIEFEDLSGQSVIRAKVWPDGAAEPTGWSVDCFDDSVDRSAAGTIGVWSNGAGTKHFDDLRVQALDPGAPLDLTVDTVGGGIVVVDPALPTYSFGDLVTLTASPTAGWVFGGWSDGLGSDPVIDLILTADRTVTATFVLAATIVDEDFESTPVLGDPVDWFDTAPFNSLDPDDDFAVFDLVAGGDRHFGTNSSATNIHSHYGAAGSDAFADYAFTGRMLATAANGGIGVTFLSHFTDEARYYRLRRFGTGSFFIDPLGTLMTGGTIDSGVVPAPNTWYRFRIEAQDTGIRTEVRARVWADGTPEPTDWPIDCFDDSVDRLTAGTIGVWTFSSGSKFFDDFLVTPLAALPSVARGFRDHFDAGALDSRWNAVTLGAGSVTTSDSALELRSDAPTDVAFVATDQPIDLSRTQTWLFCARNLGGGNLEDFIALWSLPDGVSPDAGTLADPSAQRVAAISLVDDGPNSTVRFTYEPTNTGPTRFWHGEPINTWSTPGAVADAVASIRTGSGADFSVVGLDLDAENQRLRLFALHRVGANLADDAQGVRMVALTDWVLYSSIGVESGVGSASLDHVWLTVGDRHADAHAAQYEVEWVKLEDGASVHAYTNVRRDSTEPYTLRHVTSRDTLFLPDGRGVDLIPTTAGWDAAGHRKKHVLRDTDGIHYLFFEGFDVSGQSTIGLATSPAPEGPWTPFPLNPLITPALLPGSSSYDVLTAPLVIKNDGESDPNRRWALFFVGEVEGTSIHRIFSFRAPAPFGPWTQEVGAGPDGALLWESGAGDWKNDGVSDPKVSYDETSGEWHMYYSGIDVGNGWSVGHATSSDLVNWVESSANPIIAGDPNGVRSWNSANGRFITVSDTSAMRPDAVVFIRNQSTTEEWGISRIRNIEGNTLELYHEIAGVSGTASNRTVAQIGSGSITPHALRRDADGNYRLFVTAFQPFILGLGAFGNCEVTASLTSPTPIGPWTWDDLAAPNAPLDIWNAHRANENLGWIAEPVDVP